MKRKFLAKIKTALLCISLCALLVSCSPQGNPQFPSPPFDCDILWSFNGCQLGASLSVSESGLDMRVTKPDCLSGARLYLTEDTARYSYGDMALEHIPKGLLDAARLFREGGAFKYLCKTEIDGEEALCYSKGNTRWYFSSDLKTPLRVENDGIWVQILRIE